MRTSTISAVYRFAGLLAMIFLLSLKGWAQWQTQKVTLKPGWNSVYLHVDASHTSLDSSIGSDPSNPIEEVWLWRPVLTPDRFITNPLEPVSSADWSSWKRSAPSESTLARLIGNAAFLVRNNGAIDYVWSIKGKPVPPAYQWTSKGVNLVGFSTPSDAPPLFNAFLGPVQRLASEGEFYRYNDGNNDLTPSIFNALFYRVPVTRGEAFWIKHENEFNRYFGAFEISLQKSSGIHLGGGSSQYSLRVRNMTPGELTVTLDLRPSEPAPTGESVIAGTPSLLIRGPLDPFSLTYASTDFSASQQVKLKPRGQPGSESELILGVNRAAMTGNPDDLFAGILRATDSLGYTQIDLPVTAKPASSDGLWVGNALVNQVRHFLKHYERDPSGELVQSPAGKYVVTNTLTSLGSVPRPFNLRLIVHKSPGQARLLQRVYHGSGLASNVVITTREALLHPAFLESARRISAAHLPFSESNEGWEITGEFRRGQTVNAQVNLSFNDYSSNPFLHGFHPDHDNLNATFDAAEPRGSESYDVERRVTLTFMEPGNDFASLVSGGNQMNGQYAEAIIFRGGGQESLQIDTAGTFVLRRISETAALTTQ